MADSPQRHVCVLGTQWGDEGKGKIVDVLSDSFVVENGKEALSLFYYDKNKDRWIKFKDQVMDTAANKTTVTLKKWIKDPPAAWGG